jgi:hypothetical protein
MIYNLGDHGLVPIGRIGNHDVKVVVFLISDFEQHRADLVRG